MELSKELQIVDKSDQFAQKYDVIVNGLKQGIIQFDGEKYFAMSNSAGGGKAFNSKFFNSLDKAKNYIYSKTKTIFPLTSRSIYKELGYSSNKDDKIQ